MKSDIFEIITKWVKVIYKFQTQLRKIHIGSVNCNTNISINTKELHSFIISEV